jgi:hypothetical protein
LVEPVSTQRTLRRDHLRAPECEYLYARLFAHSRPHRPLRLRDVRAAHLEHEARAVVTERRDSDPEGGAVFALDHDLDGVRAGTDRLLCQTAARWTVRRSAAEDFTTGLSERVEPEDLVERAVTYEHHPDAVAYGYAVGEMLEHFVEHAPLAGPGTLRTRVDDFLSKGHRLPPTTFWGVQSTVRSVRGSGGGTNDEEA